MINTIPLWKSNVNECAMNFHVSSRNKTGRMGRRKTCKIKLISRPSRACSDGVIAWSPFSNPLHAGLFFRTSNTWVSLLKQSNKLAPHAQEAKIWVPREEFHVQYKLVKITETQIDASKCAIINVQGRQTNLTSALCRRLLLRKLYHRF